MTGSPTGAHCLLELHKALERLFGFTLSVEYTLAHTKTVRRRARSERLVLQTHQPEMAKCQGEMRYMQVDMAARIVTHTSHS